MCVIITAYFKNIVSNIENTIGVEGSRVEILVVVWILILDKMSLAFDDNLFVKKGDWPMILRISFALKRIKIGFAVELARTRHKNDYRQKR